MTHLPWSINASLIFTTLIVSALLVAPPKALEKIRGSSFVLNCPRAQQEIAVFNAKNTRVSFSKTFYIAEARITDKCLLKMIPIITKNG